MAYARKSDDYVPYEQVPEGRASFQITTFEGAPKVNAHIFKFEFTDAEGRSFQAKYDIDKKNAKGKHAQRFYFNQLIDAIVGDEQAFTAANILNAFVELDVFHNVVDRMKEGEIVYKADGVTPEQATFVNIAKVIGPGEPFEGTSSDADNAPDPLAGLTDEDEE